MTTIDSFIHRKVVVLHQDDAAHQAARAMCDRKIGCVVVADHDGHIVGMVTDRDLVCGILAYPSDAHVPLSEVMTPNPAMVDENASLEKVIGLMQTHGIRRIPVVHRVLHGNDQRAKCVGIVSLDDLIASRSITMDQVVQVVQTQIFRRKNPLTRDFRGYRSQVRAEARADDKLNRFFNIVSEKTGLSEEVTVKIVTFLLGSIVQRLHFTGAAHLIAQLPKNMQEQLLDLPAGPDRSITPASMISEMSRQFGYEEGMARELLIRVTGALESVIEPGQWDHVRAQLPEDIRLLLGMPARTTPLRAA